MQRKHVFAVKQLIQEHLKVFGIVNVPPNFGVVADVEPIYAKSLFGYERGRTAAVAVNLYNAVQDVNLVLARLDRCAVTE